MEQVGGEHEGQRTSVRQVITASVVGSVLEWYDFSLYGTAAALVFSQLFFPSFDPLAATLASFGTFAVGFFARPVGGIVFGHYGDKIGRKAVLIITLMLMGVATALIGLLPGYETIGVWAPILLLILRILQGFGSGAEFAGAVIMTAEYSPEGRRGFYASWPCTGVLGGILLAAGVFNLVALLPEEQFLAWGWRVPFLLSLLVVAVGLYIRFRILETPVFAHVKETHTETSRPIIDVVRGQPKNLLVGIGACVAERGPSYIFQVFVLTYVAHLGLPENVALTGVLIAAGLGIFTVLAFGALSDKVGRRPVYMGGAAFVTLFAFPYFWLLDTESTVLIWLAIVLSYGVGIMAMFGPQAAYFTELFDARVRYSGVALSREVTAAFTGGISPFVATALLGWASGESWPIAIYIAAMGLITLVALYFGPETYQSEMPEKQDREHMRPQPTS
jgi:MFS transporter, MHS family, shikimate and dehydroshikimate transport protein